jgi:hypothetical protein
MQSILNKFSVTDIIAIDTEYSAMRKGCHLQPLCLGMKSLVTGESWFQWHYPDAPQRPPWLDLENENILWVTFAAAAEWSYLLAAGYCDLGGLPTNIIDLYAEDALRINGRLNAFGNKAKAKLIYAMQRSRIPDPYSDKKEFYQKLIGNCEDFGTLTPQQLAEIKVYQMQDVDSHAALFLAMEPDMNAGQALNRGDFSRVVASYEWHGLPIDIDTTRRLERQRARIQSMTIEEMESKHEFGVYEKDPKDNLYHWSDERFATLVKERGLADVWPETSPGSGIYCVADPKRGGDNKKVFKSMCQIDPYFEPLRIGSRMADDFKTFNLPIGDDGRVRASNLPFAQKGMRSSPHGGSIFAMDARYRWLIQTAPGRSAAYIDLSSCEFVVAAVLSGDKNMLRICNDVRNDPTKNVYVEIMKAASVAKPDATKKTVGKEYKNWKTGGLATLYGQEAIGLCKNLNVRMSVATFIHDFFHTFFSTYWSFINKQLVRGQSRGFMETRGGWRLDTRHQKQTTLKNFPVQANACEILHLGAVKMVDSGLQVCTTVHDAVFIEADTDEINGQVQLAQECFADAGMEVIGYPIQSDAYIFSGRFEDDDGEDGWKSMLSLLKKAEAAEVLELGGCNNGEQ